MTAELKQGLSESVDELKWMDDDTKLLAKRKVDKLYILFQLHIYIIIYYYIHYKTALHKHTLYTR